VVAHVCTTTLAATPAAPPVARFDGWEFPLMTSRDLPHAEFGIRQVIEASQEGKPRRFMPKLSSGF